MTIVTAEFWRDRRVFLTGHTGFKGSWLSLWLTSLGARVTGLALPPQTTPNLFDGAHVQRGMASILGDIRDVGLVYETMRTVQPEIVIHMAAQPLVRYSYAHPLETYATNVMGTAHVLDAVRHTPGVRAVVCITSDKCYENRDLARPFREDDAMGGYDPYSSSKGCAELVTATYRNSYFPPAEHARHGVAIASARAGNVIGGGDWSTDRLIPDVVQAFNEGRVVRVRSPHAIRPWQHVLEPLGGYLLLAQALYERGAEFSEGWNFGSEADGAQSVQWIVEKFTAAWGALARWTLDSHPHPHESQVLSLDSTKAQTRLGWRSVWTLEETLSRIVAWHKAQQAGGDMLELCLAEIVAYQHDMLKAGR